jgi:hypothetical protein
MQLRFFQNIKNSNRKLFDFTGACKVTIDYNKYHSSRAIYLTGLNNYTLFQKFSNFKWPAWINVITDPTHGVTAVSPFMLINSNMRDRLYFTNFLSDDGLFIDPAGMISPSYDHWSLEAWFVSGNALYRPSEDWQHVRQERDTKNSLIYSVWENSLCKLQYTLYGARSTVDEAIVEADCFIKERRQASILFVVRPYDLHQLGGLESVEFQKESLSLSINGRRSVCFSAKPDYVLSGGGEQCRDIDPNGDEPRQSSSSSQFGMATLGIGFKLKKGENRITFRIALDSREGLVPRKYDLAKAREDYTAFSSARIRSGANVALPDKAMQNWFYGSKISLLNFSLKNIFRENGTIDYRTAFYIIFGCNRMGYFPESLRYIDYLIKNFTGGDNNYTFETAGDACATMESIADYFIHVRDTAFLQGRLDFIKKTALGIYSYSKKIKRPGTHKRNSLQHYSIAEEHPFDFILIAHALAQYSYMTRCLGIFGEELKYKKESERIAAILGKAAFDAVPGRPENEFIYYNLFAGFPFRIEAIPETAIRGLLDRMRSYFSELPLIVKSLGLDTFATLVAANNLLLMSDAKANDIIDTLLRMRNMTYILPEFMNPATGRAVWGDSSSMVVSAMAFATIRNLLFVDHPERLNIFPLPRAEWFEPGNEMKIEDAPSRFGSVSLRIVSTVNEIQVHFDKLPKFVPPEILIRMPYKTKIKLEDDFILKREDDTTFIINGWPSIVRFIRK